MRGPTTGAQAAVQAKRSAKHTEAEGRSQVPWVLRHSTWRELLLLVAVVLVVSTTIKLFLVQAFYIPSGSMENTIQIGDKVVVDKLTPWFGATPQRGQIVVFQDPGGWLDSPRPASTNPVERYAKDALILVGLLPEDGQGDLIKRVIGIPGDHVVCCNAQKQITVNGVPLTEPYVMPGDDPSDIPFNIVVPPGRLWVLGDNRGNSSDSRYHLGNLYDGTIPESSVVGRADAVVWPIGDMKMLSVPATFSQNFTAAAAGGLVGPDNPPATVSVLVGTTAVMRRRRRRRAVPIELLCARPRRALRGPLSRLG